ncbi:MAG TPA: hypothetical protein PLP29_04765 [Candidatus Ozemobacteraceae bacterium]|nr:hypothetical protein [Candidatus Ozemobacteraceae bacterium]
MKCLNGASLEAHIESLRFGRPDPKIEAHLATCRRCALLVEHAARPMPAGLAARAEQIGRLLRTKRPETIEPGQIWRLREQIQSEHYFIGVVTRGPEMSIDPNHPDVRMAMASLDANESDVQVGDIVVEHDESPLGLRYLIEHWNERPVPAAELEICLGRLAEAAWKRLEAALCDLGEEEELSEAVRAYRTRRIRETAALSHKSLERAARAMSEDQGSEPAAPGWRGSAGPLFFEFAANEFLRAVAADKDLTPFRIFGRIFLGKLRALPSDLGLAGRETPKGFRFRLRDPRLRMVMEIFGPKGEILTSADFSEGILQLTEEMIPDWKSVSGVNFLTGTRNDG